MILDLKPAYTADHDIRFCVTGTPRSGTKRIATALRAAGQSCQHESEDGRHGIVDWMWLFRERNPGRVKRLIVTVREPLPCIRSIAVHKIEVQEWFCAISPVSMEMTPIMRAARFYLFWNRMLLSIADAWYRLEDDDSCLDVLGVYGVDQHCLDTGDRNRNELNLDLLTDNDRETLDRFKSGNWLDDLDNFTIAGIQELASDLGYKS